jgi:Na+/H+ antiporter NhaD/arsenite permease-like protein
VAYALIATEKVNRVVVALAGAGLMLAFGLVSSEDAFHSTDFGIDWEVIFLLLGMMIVVGVMKQTGLFEYLAIWSAKRAKGQPYRIMVALVVLTAVASAFLDNVTTVLLVAPVTILICERLELPPAPYLIALALASNIGGTATLIGDPPQHHHRQPGRPHLPGLPDQPSPPGGGAVGRLDRHVPGVVPLGLHLPVRAGGRAHGP